MSGPVVCAIGFGGCLGLGEAPRTKPVACLEAAAGGERGEAAAVALLQSVHPRTGAFERQTDRLIRFSLPDGELEAERVLGRPAARQEVDSLRLVAKSGPRLVTTRDPRTVLVLIRNPVSARDHVAAIDARTLRTRCRHPLEPGVRYGGLLLGRSGRLHAFGVRPAGRGRWDAVVTAADARTGKLMGTRSVREADQAATRVGRDWWPYSGALAADERWLVLSYHGGDTTGADAVRTSPGAGAAAGPTDAGYAHGAVAAVEGCFVAATGGDRLLRLDHRGRVTARLPIRATKNHLMDFAVDPRSRRAYLSSCGRRPAVQRLDLDRGTPETVQTGAICGRPLAVYRDRFLVLDASRVTRLGYAMTRPAGLRILDLDRPGGVRRVPRSVGAHDAVVVEGGVR